MDITDLRKEIDDVDNVLIRLFSQRMDIAANIARYKHEHDLPIFIPAREKEVLRSVSENSLPQLAQYIRVLYSMIFELSRAYQSKQLSQLSCKIKDTRDVPPDSRMFRIELLLPDETDVLFKVIAKQHLHGIRLLRFNAEVLSGNMFSYTIDIDNSSPSPHLLDFLNELKDMSETFSIIEHPSEVAP